MSPLKHKTFSRKSLFVAVLFASFGVGGAAAQDITPGSSVMEAKSKKPPVRAKTATKAASAANNKPASKPAKTNGVPRSKNDSPPAAKRSNSQPKENADQKIERLDLEAVVTAAPVYPGAAKQAGAAGAVRVEVLVDENGDVVSAEAKEGHELLRPTAEAAARASKFVPRRVKGKAVKTRGYLIYCFGGGCD